MDFAFGKIKKFINKHYGENNNKIIKGHGYVFITYKNELGVGCTVKREG